MTHSNDTSGVAGQSTPQGSAVSVSQILEQVDDTKILALLERPLAKDGRTGRPAFPLRALLRAFLSKYVLNLEYNLDLVSWLQRDPELRRVCGFEGPAPSPSTLSRFYKRLVPHADALEECFSAITKALRPYLPGLGKSVAIDSTDVEAWANGMRKKEKLADTDARWGWRHSARLNTSRGKAERKELPGESRE